ncbi:hypothetical protein CAPTEDRAFT_228084 [Capitella teleta]|uniref:Uncharacterized protein n=1 Tax=Capitella teleta TaxID=283909 RepID=R7USA1_CAPTE|nr:hypothetical protein CAPTEDRAFT_228084 [Capitella teleta]|eukprot:ELU09018.1 hypothetical protein CAPTEDRAFT_228084 [Capitella teleta]
MRLQKIPTKGVAGFLVPQRERCFIIENAIEDLPVLDDSDEEQLDVDEPYRPKSTIRYEPEKRLSKERVAALIPTELKSSCIKWPTFSLIRDTGDLDETVAFIEEERRKRQVGRRHPGFVPHDRPHALHDNEAPNFSQYCLLYFSTDICSHKKNFPRSPPGFANLVFCVSV